MAVIVAVWTVRVGIHLPGRHGGASATVFADSSRALGIAALMIACAALPIGLIVGRRLTPARGRAEIRDLHRTVALWVLAAIALHLLALIGARTLHPSVIRLAVPFAWPYRTVATGLGVLGTWVIAALGPSYYLRRRIGERRWRIAHRFIGLGLLLGILHTIGGG
jgi:sulfoxide reductase heme-binding subunit YedZ